MAKYHDINQIITDSSNLGPDQNEEFDKLRVEAFEKALEVFNDRAKSYDQLRPPYTVFAFGLLSLVSHVYDKAWRLTQLLAPTRTGEMREEDVKRVLDTTIDAINYLSWVYAITTLVTGVEGHEFGDDNFFKKAVQRKKDYENSIDSSHP